MQATGIPEHYKIAEELNVVREEVKELRSERKRDLHTVVENMNELPAKLSGHLLDNFQFNGLTPITQTYLHDTLRIYFQNIINDLLPRLERREVSNEESNFSDNNGTQPSVFQFFHWGGRMMRIFPQNFHMRNMPVKMIWNLCTSEMENYTFIHTS